MTFDSVYASLISADLGYILSFLPNGYRTIEVYDGIWTFDKAGNMTNYESRKRA